jgi:hypothetical protein
MNTIVESYMSCERGVSGRSCYRLAIWESLAISSFSLIANGNLPRLAIWEPLGHHNDSGPSMALAIKPHPSKHNYN